MANKQEIQIIVCSTTLSKSISEAKFSYFSSNNSRFIEVDADGLAKDVFTKLNKNFTQNSGEVKDINKTTNDDFQLFTRQKLSRYIVANDIDAIIFNEKLFNHQEKMVFLELKRIDTKHNTLDTWTPYFDDFNNYVALEKIAARVNNSKMRVVVYTKEENEFVAVHYLDEIKKDGSEKIISGLRIVCDIKSSYQIPIGVKYLLKK